MSRYVLNLLFILGAIFIFLVYLNPEWKRTRDLRKENQDLRSLSQELTGLIENRDFLLDSINRISKGDLEKINESLPQGQEAAPLISFLELLSGRNGLVLKNIELSDKIETKTSDTLAGQPRPGISISPPKPAGIVRDLPINLNLLGTYESFKGFLGDLEGNLRLIEVQNLNFSSTGSRDLFSFNLKVVTHYQ